MTVPKYFFPGLLFLSMIFHDSPLLSQNHEIQNYQIPSDTTRIDSLLSYEVADSPITLSDYFGKENEIIKPSFFNTITALDPAEVIRGRSPGIRVVKPTGDPTIGGQIRFRSITSLTRPQDPLIILDGTITNDDLHDINMDDIQNIDIIKGSEAGVLYGSLGSNGVIILNTFSGDNRNGGTKIKLKSEFGINRLTNNYPLNTLHGYQNDSGPMEANYGFLLNGIGQRQPSMNGLVANDYLADTYDNEGEFLSGGNFRNNHLSITSRKRRGHYHFSFSEMASGGLVTQLPKYRRRNFKAAVHSKITDRLEISLASSYGMMKGAEPENFQPTYSLFEQVLLAEPFIHLQSGSSEDSEGNKIYDPIPAGMEILAKPSDNPFYVARKLSSTFDRKRLLGSASITYEILDGLHAGIKHSIDKSNHGSLFIRPKDFFYQGGIDFIDGWVDDYEQKRKTNYTTGSITYKSELTDSWKSHISIAYVNENFQDDVLFVRGTELNEGEVLGIDDTMRQDSTNNKDLIKSESVVGGINLNYKNLLQISGLIRNEGVSSYGINERRQWFYHTSLEYQLAALLSESSLTDLSLKASYGRNGLRPPIEAQFDRFNVDNDGTIDPIGEIRGNKDIRPSRIDILEIGFEGAFQDKYTFQLTLDKTGTKDDFLRVPASSVTGFRYEWMNLAELEGSTIELGIGMKLMDNKSFSWHSNLYWSRTKQNIKTIGREFTNEGIATVPRLGLYGIKEGDELGNMYGNIILTDISELSVDDNGIVLNPNSSDLNRSLTSQDFYINEDGYVIASISDNNGNPVEAQGTALEQVVYKSDSDGNLVEEVIGNSQPDWNLSFVNNIKYNRFSFFFLLDHQQGGDIYNHSKQLLYDANRHQDLQLDGTRGKRIEYRNGDSRIYNNGNASSHFIEDASFTKLREVAIGYSFDVNKLGMIGKHLSAIDFTLIGRNLLTFTSYTGYDPEVALASNATTYSYDRFPYPQMRTFSARLAVEF